MSTRAFPAVGRRVCASDGGFHGFDSMRRDWVRCDRMTTRKTWLRVEAEKWDEETSNLKLLRTPCEESPGTRVRKTRA
jgi:hypothetical protein